MTKIIHTFFYFSNTLSNKQILGWAPSSRDLLRAIGLPWNHLKMVLSFSAKNNLCCWTFPSVWWCHDVYLLFPMRAVGRPRGSQCTWLWYDCEINIRSKNMFFSNYVPSLFLGLLTCPNPCLVGPCTQSRRYWWRLPSPLLPGWYYISLTTFHQVWNIFLVVPSQDLELFTILRSPAWCGF